MEPQPGEDRRADVDRGHEAALLGRRGGQVALLLLAEPRDAGPEELAALARGEALHGDRDLAGGSVGEQGAQLGAAGRAAGKLGDDQLAAVEKPFDAPGEGRGGARGESCDPPFAVRRDGCRAVRQRDGTASAVDEDLVHPGVGAPAGNARREQARGEELGCGCGPGPGGPPASDADAPAAFGAERDRQRGGTAVPYAEEAIREPCVMSSCS